MVNIYLCVILCSSANIRITTYTEKYTNMSLWFQHGKGVA